MLFISYAREDRQAAAQLVNELDAEGINYVIDPDLTEGDPFWRETIVRRFSECELMVGLASLHAECSPWVEQEQRAFPGPKLWIAVDHSTDRVPLLAGAPSELVQPGEALRAIYAALPVGRYDRRRKSPNRVTRHGQRSQHMREQQRRLDAFLRSHSRQHARTLDISGDSARTRNGSIELELCAVRTEPQERTIFIGTQPVTNGQYRAFIDATGYEEPPTWRRPTFCANDAPVTGVNWFEACAFAAWVGGNLPTEAEWLRAACGRDPLRRFATVSGNIDSAVAYYERRFGSCAPVAARTYRPNLEGFYGLCGNTWDWCASCWGSHRVIRGGGCMDVAAFCTTDTRYRNAPIDRDCCVGFRVKIASQSSH